MKKNKFISIVVACLVVSLTGCATTAKEENTGKVEQQPSDKETVSYIDQIQEQEEIARQIEEEEEQKRQEDRAMRAEWVRQSRAAREAAEKLAEEAAAAAATPAQSSSYSYSNYSYSDYDYEEEEEEEETTELEPESEEPVTEEVAEESVSEDPSTAAASSEAKHSPSEFRRDGVYYEDGYRWTWYSERVLPGGGLDIPGRYTDEQGYVKDEDGYICLASEDLEQGTVVETPFGSEGKVYDNGCDSGTLDVYVGW